MLSEINANYANPYSLFLLELAHVSNELGVVVVEPSGALGLAALMSKTVHAEGKIGIIISGGNIDAEMMTKILNT